MVERSRFVWLVTTLSVVLFFSSGVLAFGDVFNVASGDVAGLIAAINTANANGEPDTINLAPGRYTLMTADNGTAAPFNGLPVITSVITINGADAETTIIAPGVSNLRVFSIATSGDLTVNRIGVNGSFGMFGPAGAFANAGNFKIDSSIISGHDAGGESVIFNAGTGTLKIVRTHLMDSISRFTGILRNLGTMTIESSSITGNFGADSIIDSPGDAIIRNSTFGANGSTFGSIIDGQKMTIVGSTITGRIPHGGHALSRGAVRAGEGTRIVNSTITEINGASSPALRGNNVELQNSIVAGNGGTDCSGTIISAGNNLVGDCPGMQLLPSDLTGDPGLDAFLDDGAPGHGHYPLLPGSAAIDHGNYSICALEPSLQTDQIGLPRRGACDIGSAEFFPVVNGSVALTGITTSFDPAAGTFLINATFQNTSTRTIDQPFVQVSQLTRGLLLNAEGGRGGVGAWLPLNGAGPFTQGASRTVQLRVGFLQQGVPFTFFVNVLGDQ